jgi:Domain of unknown function (DUF4184)
MLVLSAAVVGSMAPDFRYFLDLAPHGHFSHSIKGIFLFCLPVGLAVLWVFQKVMKLPLISLAPAEHQERLAGLAAPFRWWPVKRFALILASLLVGTITHLVWDAFTHDRGFMVRNLPDLRAHALEEFGSHRPLFNLLQHGSSLLGMALLAFWYWRWFKRTPPGPVPSHLRLDTRVKVWTTASIVALSGGLSLAYAYQDSYHLESRSIFVGTAVITFMSTVCVALVGFSLWWHWRARRNQDRETGSSGDRVIRASNSDDPMSRSPDHPISL